jgi:acetyl esterase/lipase
VVSPGRITVTGDSLGAGTATLLAMYMAQKYGDKLEAKVSRG